MAESPPAVRAPRVAMVVFSYYPDDPRVRREAEAMVDAGIQVDVICLKKDAESSEDTFHSVCIHRLPVVRKRGTPLRYLWEYVTFFVLASFKLCVLHWRQPYHIVHVHNMPDFLVFTALVPKLNGAKVILDLHDPMPEVFMTKYGLPETHLLIRIFLHLETASIRFANIVLTPNLAFKRLFANRGCPDEKIYVIMNTPDEKVFGRKRSISGIMRQSPNDFLLMYHGTIVERHGLDTALDAVVSVRERIPSTVLHVFGDGDFVPNFLARVHSLQLDGCVCYHGMVSLEVIAASIEQIDVGIIPNKRSVFTEINLPTRIFEYLAKGKHVVASRTSGILDYFDENTLNFFEPENARSLAEVLINISMDPGRAKRVLLGGEDVYKFHSWDVERKRLLTIMHDLGREK